jgi:hypothetical protein
MIKQIVVGDVGYQSAQQASSYAARQRRRAQNFTQLRALDFRQEASRQSTYSGVRRTPCRQRSH